MLENKVKDKMDSKEKSLKCNICSKKIEHEQIGKSTWTIGHNAYPIHMGTPHEKYGYRCCNNCEEKIVLPARISLIAINGTTLHDSNPNVTKLMTNTMRESLI